MATPTPAQLRERLEEIGYQSKWKHQERALLGKLDNDGNKVVVSATRPGWVYVRISRGGELSETEAINTKVANEYGVKVWVGPNQDGHLTVLDIREGENVEEHGSNAAILTVPEVTTKGTIGIRRLQPGLVVCKQLAGAYTMSVYVHEFTYLYNGALQRWPGGWLDLTGNVPATSGKRHWTLIGLNPVTNALSTVDGVDYGLPVSLSATQLMDIDPGTLIPLAGANLFNGMTTVDRENYLQDARPWFTPPLKDYTATVQTTDATATVIASVAVAEATGGSLRIEVIGLKSGGGAGYSCAARYGFRRATGGNVTMIGAGTIGEDEDSAGTPAFTCTANTTDQTVELKVTGIAAETWDWSAHYVLVTAP